MPTNPIKQTVPVIPTPKLSDRILNQKILNRHRKRRPAPRSFSLMLVAFSYGKRVSELVDVRLKDIDLETGRIYVRRVKGSLPTHKPIEGDELRSIRVELRKSESYPSADSYYLFLSERGTLTR